MKSKKKTFEQELIDLVTPYVLEPKNENAKLVIIELLNKIVDEFAYDCNICLNEIDEFYGRMYGAGRINSDTIEGIIYNLQIMNELS